METSNQVIEALIESLDDQSEDVRKSACAALGKLGVTAVSELVAAIDYEEGYNILRFIGAARALADIGPDAMEAVPGLLRGLRFRPAQEEFADAAAELRSAAAFALGEICSDTSTSRSKAS